MNASVRRAYVQWIRPRFGYIGQQRVKLLWFVWGYRRLFGRGIDKRQALRLLRAFLWIDWHVPHAHFQGEMAAIVAEMLRRGPRPGTIAVEAGCWKGGSSAKFSLVCGELGIGLQVFDSFEGVEPIGSELPGCLHDFSGEYAAREDEVRVNVERYGNVAVCSFHKGWFADTLKPDAFAGPVSFVYIDCDLAKGTREVIEGVLPALTDDALVFTQDWQVRTVRALFSDTAAWDEIGVAVPAVESLTGFTARIALTR